MKKKAIEYSLPEKIFLTYGVGMSLLFTFLGIFFLTAAFILPGTDANEDKFFLVYEIGTILLSLMMFGIILVYNVFKKIYIEITKEGFDHQNLFGKKSFYWYEIADVTLYTVNSAKLIGFITHEKIEKMNKSPIRGFETAIGTQFAVSLPLAALRHYGVEKLLGILTELIEKNQGKAPGLKETVQKPSYSEEDGAIKESGSSLIFRPIIAALVGGLIYGLTLYLLPFNLLIIPIVFWTANAYMVDKYSVKPSLGTRFYTSFLNVLSLISAYFFLILFALIFDFGLSTKNINDALRTYILEFDKILLLIMIIGALITGILKEATDKIIKK